jgi:putative SOS response-associated peptidase YedK
MCNLYSVTKSQQAIRDLFAVKHDRAGNLPPLPAILPDQMAPVVRIGADGERELVMARWGMPGPPQSGGRLVTNIRHVQDPHWRRWVRRESRCIVAVTSFCEFADARPGRMPLWLALGEDRPLFAFAGLWRPWRGVRGPKGAPVDGDHELFALLLTKATWTIAPIRPMSMPVILATSSEVDRWLEADIADAFALRRPFPDDAMQIVAKGERKDAGLSLTKSRAPQ